ncbi:MAG: prolipoprotein diacylglyceryl transferase [Oscillospiraceae bacterium]|nr:prolipoprotein diacylglyceryl transferase [Oscillospiraceae bacterium]
MTYNPIEFPGLGIGPIDFNPTAFTVFGLGIQWYGIIIALGFALAAIYCSSKTSAIGIKSDDFTDALFFAVPLAIVGARLYYVVFNFSRFRNDPLNMFNIREGGVAIYGAVIFALATAYIYARIRKISPLDLLDLGVMGLLIGQCIGRWGNFANRELFGTRTSLPWRMEIYIPEFGERAAVHPAFLYESLWNAAGFLLLHFLLKKREYSGQLLLIYLAWYGLGRGFIEGIRTDSLYLLNTGLRVSQVLAFASCAAALGLLTYFRLRKRAP